MFAQMQMPGMPGGQRYQPNYDEVKAVLGLTDDQLAKLKQFQQDKMAATQSFYAKMSDKQKELNLLLESNSADPTKIGTLMLELQTLRKQPAPGGSDVHEKAIESLSAEQKMKLGKLEEALKMRNAADQATQLGLLLPPPPAPRPAGAGPLGTIPVPPPQPKK